MGGSHFAVLQYDGTDFAGWQRQPDQRTVQAEIEAALRRLADAPTPCTAAGRTDAGVHAREQVISFELSRRWDGPDLTRALRALTPRDVWIVRSGPAPEGFHARRDAAARRYQYVIGTDAAAASPFRFRRSMPRRRTRSASTTSAPLPLSARRSRTTGAASPGPLGRRARTGKDLSLRSRRIGFFITWYVSWSAR
jgi:tRNA pseudouridine38-40 synthase